MLDGLWCFMMTSLNIFMASWKQLPRYWPFVRGIHRSQVDFSLTETSDAELWCFLWITPEQTVEQAIGTLVIWDAIALIITSIWCFSVAWYWSVLYISYGVAFTKAFVKSIDELTIWFIKHLLNCHKQSIFYVPVVKNLKDTQNAMSILWFASTASIDIPHKELTHLWFAHAVSIHSRLVM